MYVNVVGRPVGGGLARCGRAVSALYPNTYLRKQVKGLEWKGLEWKGLIGDSRLIANELVGDPN